MHEHVEVIYENGVLRPLGPLPSQLYERQHLTITIDRPDTLQARLDTACIDAAKKDGDSSVSLDEVRRILAKVPGSLAEAIIADRADR